MSGYKWDDKKKQINACLCNKGYSTGDGIYYKNESASFFIIPLSELRKLRNCRCDNNNYSSPSIILISSSKKNPFVNNESIDNDILKPFFGNPEFGNIEKAIFFGECNDIKNGSKFIFDVTQFKWSDNLLSLTEEVTKVKYQKKHLKKYYETFVDYYFPDKKDITDIDKIDFTVECKLKDNEGKEVNVDIPICKDNFEIAEKAYCKLNVIDYNEQVHRVKFELFRAPVPFPLQELVDAKEEIEDSVGWKNGKEGKTIKLFLIDNKTDKFKMENNKSTVCDVFEEFGIAHLFDIEMVGIGESKGFKSEYERFDFKKFKDKKQLEELEDSEKEYYQKLIDHYKFSKIQTYEDLIYNKIKSSHFILLDFFLNKENTYLAFDFIRDISEIKNKKGDYSTTWYFITSAVYDSVVKYSQSGLLAEYYESTVVNVGDDPTNKKRQIIFVYKLLTFIQSRLRSFKTYKDAIYNLMLNDEKENGKLVCCVISTNKNKKIAGCLENCEKDNCLKNMQTYIKRYLTEYDNIWSLFYYEENKKDYNDIAELLDDTIKKFLWLPEAEWQIVQHQIDYINAKLKDVGEGRKFSCNYINKEIKQRSEIY